MTTVLVNWSKSVTVPFRYRDPIEDARSHSLHITILLPSL